MTVGDDSAVPHAHVQYLDLIASEYVDVELQLLHLLLFVSHRMKHNDCSLTTLLCSVNRVLHGFIALRKVCALSDVMEYYNDSMLVELPVKLSQRIHTLRFVHEELKICSDSITPCF